jgi:hypothetical protein
MMAELGQNDCKSGVVETAIELLCKSFQLFRTRKRLYVIRAECSIELYPDEA